MFLLLLLFRIPKGVAKAMGEFFLGFVEVLGNDIGFYDCIQDVKVYQDVKTIVDFIHQGINGRVIQAIAKGFELLGELLKDNRGEAIVACVKDAIEFANKMKDLGAALSGNVWSSIKVVIDELVHIFHERKGISDDFQERVTAYGREVELRDIRKGRG